MEQYLLAKQYADTAKRDKSVKLEQADLSETLQTQIAGTAGLLSIPQDNSIYPNKFNVIELGANLIDLNDCTSGYYVSDTTGELVASASYLATNYIQATANITYFASNSRRAAFYDANKLFISGFNGYSGVAPANASFIRISVLISSKDTEMLSETAKLTTYTPFSAKIPWLRVEKDNIKSIPQISSYDISQAQRNVNLFDKNSVTDGYYIDVTNGLLVANATYTVSDFIPAKENTNYTVSYQYRYGCYDKDKRFISGAILSVASFTTPANTVFIRVTATITNKGVYMIVEGNTLPTAYVSFGVSVPWLNGVKSKYHGKKMVCFGDSITYSGYPAIVEQDTGITVINQGYSSARVVPTGDAGDEVKDKFSLTALVDSIISGVWTNQDIIYSTTGYETQAAQLDVLKTIDFNTVDFISLSDGTNDWASSTSIVDNELDPLDVANVIGGLRYVVKKFLDNYPHLKFLIMTPIYRFHVDVDGTTIIEDSDTWVNSAGYKIPDIVSAYKILGQELKFPVVDMYNELGINKYNRIYYFGPTYDGVHPNGLGEALMGHKLAGTLLTY